MHKGVGWTFFRTIGGWPFAHGKATVEMSPPPAARASDGEAARALALGGVGLARLALFHIGPDIEAGRLVPVLQDFNPGDCEDIHAVFLGQGGPLPARVRTFIDFLGENIRLDDLDPARTRNGEWQAKSACAQLR
jgi:DNA-binding transcriptional LysR family regulator